MAKTYIFINTYQQLFKMIRNQGVDFDLAFELIVPLVLLAGFFGFCMGFASAMGLFFKKVDKLVEIRWNSKNIQKFKNTMSFIIPDL